MLLVGTGRDEKKDDSFPEDKMEERIWTGGFTGSGNAK